jgi:hypothetical protein
MKATKRLNVSVSCPLSDVRVEELTGEAYQRQKSQGVE